MSRINRLKRFRPKAAFGIDGAINAAATLGAAAINAAATNKAAKEQATAIRDNAIRQSNALMQQNENANQLQEQQIAFQTQENARNRELQQNMQMQLQALAGQQNTMQHMDSSKIQVRNGGSAKRKMKELNRTMMQSLLQGVGGNLPFKVTDGGGAVPVGKTPEGYDLYELRGNDHKHYHKTQGGKNKTGVGIKFPDGSVIEGEGNQNSNQGELMLVTPDDVKFISKHNIKGFNPVNAVKRGMNPAQAFNIQENIKNRYGISDDGKVGYNSPVRKMYGGPGYLPMNFNLSADFSVPNITSGLIVRDRARCGKSLRRCKASLGSWWKNMNDLQKGNIIGAGMTTGANVLGSGINAIGNNIGARKIGKAYTEAGNMLSNAYNNLKTIDMNSINRNDYKSSHAMAAIQAPIVNTQPERAAAERAVQRGLSSVNNNSMSSAAAQNKSALINTAYNDNISKIEGDANKTRQAILQDNMNRITTTANENASRDLQASQAYADARTKLMQYNNDIVNSRILGSAQALADAKMQKADALASARQANAAGYSGALTGSANAFANALGANAKMDHDLEQVLLNSSSENQFRYYMRNPNAPGRNAFITSLESSTDPIYQGWYNKLTGKFPSKTTTFNAFSPTFNPKFNKSWNPSSLNFKFKGL